MAYEGNPGAAGANRIDYPADIGQSQDNPSFSLIIEAAPIFFESGNMAQIMRENYTADNIGRPPVAGLAPC